MTLLEGKLTHSFNCLTPPLLAVKLSNVFFFKSSSTETVSEGHEFSWGGVFRQSLFLP